MAMKAKMAADKEKLRAEKRHQEVCLRCVSTCASFTEKKHRHARRARVIFLCEVSEIGAFMVQ